MGNDWLCWFTLHYNNGIKRQEDTNAVTTLKNKKIAGVSNVKKRLLVL